MNKFVKGFAALSMAAAMLVGCGSNTSDAEDSEKSSNTGSGAISVVSREEGSGTRGAFIELFGVEEKDGDEKVDKTIDTAEVTNSTSVMASTVEGNEAAIGYVSLGSLSDSVKALKIDGVEPTAENVKSGDYKISRPFLICTKGDEVSDLGKDFINYIMSKEGQEIVEKEGYIAQDTDTSYTAAKTSGSLTVGGSSSVTPVMEKLAEEYQKLNPDAEISVQQSDSTTGATNTIDGVYEIGMCSRELKPEEKDAGLKDTVIATDGIAVIVNNANKVSDLTADQVKKIYTGEITDWSEIK